MKYLLSAVLAFLLCLGLYALNPAAGIRTATGMGAKIACSHHFISGLDAATIIEDLRVYSSAFGLVAIDYDDSAKSATATLFGLGKRQAFFVGDRGCTLEHEQAGVLPAAIPRPNSIDMRVPWPQGPAVGAPNAVVQDLSDRMLAQDTDEGENTRALLVVHRGEIIAESYLEGIDQQTPLLGWSMAKSVMAMLLAQLEMEGRIDENASGLFPQWRNDDRSKITLKNLLQMSSGLDFDELYLPGKDATEMLFVEPRASQRPLASPLSHPPGEHFSYSSGTTNLMALFYAQQFADASTAYEFAHQRFLFPLGLQNTVLELDPSGHFVASSYMYASARDWARLGLLLLNNGELNGQRFFKEDWRARATEENASDNDPRYGYQLWLNHGGADAYWNGLPGDAFAMAGNRSQSVMIVPSRDAIIVRLGWSKEAYPDVERFSRLLEALPKS